MPASIAATSMISLESEPRRRTFHEPMLKRRQDDPRLPRQNGFKPG
jgi:hypothetical protein